MSSMFVGIDVRLLDFFREGLFRDADEHSFLCFVKVFIQQTPLEYFYC